MLYNEFPPRVAIARTLALLTFGLAVSASSAEVEGESDKQEAHQVDQMFSKWNRPGSPGCAIGIFRDGEILYSRGFGYAHLDYDIPISTQTVFETGYFSAAFTSACIALLMDQGKISPDDNIRQYVPELYDFNPPVRIRHLIRSRSGLWSLYSVMKLSGWNYVPIEYPLTKSDVLAVVAGQKSLPFEPGTQYRYGSTNYFLLALVVERVTGQTLAEFARQRIFEPLGMKRTSFLENPSVVVPGRAMGYHRDPWPDGEWHQWRSTNGFVFGPNAYTCVEDLYHWDQNFYENCLPRGRYMDQFITQGALLDNRDVLDIAGPTDHYRGLRRIQYYGGAYAFSCCLARFPDQKFTIVCLSNRQGMHPSWHAERIADIYLARHLESTPEEHDASDPRKKEFIELSAGELRTKVGAYRLQGTCNRVWQVSLTDGELFLTDHLDEKYPLKPVSNTQFHTQGAPRGFDRHPFVFKRTSPDQPFHLIIGEAEGRSIFDRVELANPSAVELRDYVGSYYSDELAAMYEFEVRDDALWLRVNNRRWERLDPTIRDTFIPHIRVEEDGRIINFHRNESMGVVGFDIDVPEMNDLYFTRRSDSSN